MDFSLAEASRSALLGTPAIAFDNAQVMEGNIDDWDIFTNNCAIFILSLLKKKRKKNSFDVKDDPAFLNCRRSSVESGQDHQCPQDQSLSGYYSSCQHWCG